MSEPTGQPRERFFGQAFAAAPAAMVLPLVLVACFLAQWAYSLDTTRGEALLESGALSGEALQHGQWWTLVTHMFLHGGWLHIGMNTAVALSVSTPVALALGRGAGGFSRFYALYFVCGLCAGLSYVLMQPDSALPAIGASGALSGLWGAMVRIPPTPGPLDPPWSGRVLRMSAPFVLINVVLMAVLAKTGALPVAWQAHLGGFVAGFLLIGLFVPRRATLPLQD